MSSYQSVVIVGAGVAGWRVATELRAAGFTGDVTVIGDEEPYDRPPLSKDYLAGRIDADRISLYRAGEPGSINVEVTTARVVAVDSGRVELDSGDLVEADAIVVATGARAAHPPLLDGHDDVLTLRHVADADRLRTAMSSARSLLVLGGGFIGAEVAATARTAGLEVTLIEAQDHVLAAALGASCGARVEALHREHGVHIMTGTAADHLLSSDDAMAAVLADGRRVSGDLMVAGFGAVPNVEVFTRIGVDGASGVACDAGGRVVGLDRVWAVGDVAAWHDPLLGRTVRHEHWNSAGEQATMVARHLAGTEPPPRGLPYFWSDQYDISIQVLGRPDLADSAAWLNDDNLEPQSVWASYRDDQLVAVVTIGEPRLIGRFRSRVRAGLAAVAGA